MEEEKISIRLEVEIGYRMGKGVSVDFENMGVLIRKSPANECRNTAFAMNNTMDVVPRIPIFLKISGLENFETLTTPSLFVCPAIHGIGRSNAALIPAEWDKDAILNESHVPKWPRFNFLPAIVKTAPVIFSERTCGWA
jgi:hypothetical protein